jgi:MFS family permease
MSSLPRSARPLPRVVKQLGVVSFLNDLASEMVYPLLPALVTTRLGGTALALGALDGIADAVAATVKLASGWLAEQRRRRRPLVVGGYAVAALARPLMGLATGAWQVIALRATDRLGKGARNPPRDAVIADASPGVIRGRAFGFHRAMDHAGAVVGPLVAWALIAGAGATPARVILWSVVPGVLAVMVVGWAMPSREAGSRQREADEGEGGGGKGEGGDGEAGSGNRETGSRYLFALVVLFAFARFPETLLLLRLQHLGVAVAAIPALWAALHVVRSAMSYPGGWMSDHVGHRRTMLLGWGIYAIVCFGLATAETAPAAAAWFLIFGLVAAATEAPERSLVSALGSARRRGRRFGVYHASVGLAALPGGLLLGGLYAGVGAVWALTVSGALAVLLSVLGAASRQ